MLDCRIVDCNEGKGEREKDTVQPGSLQNNWSQICSFEKGGSPVT